MTVLYSRIPEQPVPPAANDCGAPHGPETLTGMTDAVLREIAALLDIFAKTGDTAAIDLASLPLTDADRADLEKRLGRGEVEAKVSVAGDSEVWETAYAGVWWVRHRGLGGRIACEQVAITATPDILITDREDARAAAKRLSDDLAVADESANEEAANG